MECIIGNVWIVLNIRDNCLENVSNVNISYKGQGVNNTNNISIHKEFVYSGTSP